MLHYPLLVFFRTDIAPDLGELFEGGLEVFDDFLCKKVRIREIVGFFDAFIAEPEDVEAGFVATFCWNSASPKERSCFPLLFPTARLTRIRGHFSLA